MKVLTVSCNNCGAPLEVPHKTRFLTCSFCESRLEIKRSESAYYTDVLEAVDALKDDVETIKLQNELERLDREWTMQREHWMNTDKHGHRHVPSTGGGMFSMAVGVIGGTVFFVQASQFSTAFGLFGILFAVVGVLMGLAMIGRAKKYGDLRRRYEHKRRGVASELRGR